MKLEVYVSDSLVKEDRNSVMTFYDYITDDMGNRYY